MFVYVYFYVLLILNDFLFISGAIKDDEIENWAAKKIQSSFKQYKYQKTISQDGTTLTSRRA